MTALKIQHALLTGLLLAPVAADDSSAARSAAKDTVAAYCWTNFHRDAYHESKKGPGWTEWEIVKNIRPKFPGHRGS